MSEQINNKKTQKSPEIQMIPIGKQQQLVSGGVNLALTRERSFVRTSNNQQNANKRRSLAFHNQPNQHQKQIQQQQQQQHQLQQHRQHQQNLIRSGKPAMEIYRPPKLNYNLQHSSSSTLLYPSAGGNLITHSKSSANLQQMHQQMTGAVGGAYHQPNIQQPQQTPHHTHPNFPGNGGGNRNGNGAQQCGLVAITDTPIIRLPLVCSPSAGNMLQNHHRVKFAPEPQVNEVPTTHLNQLYINPNYQQQEQSVTNLPGNTYPMISANTLQRSKSLSSADSLTSGMSNLGLGITTKDIGTFIPNIQNLIDRAVTDPNLLNSRRLMELAIHLMQRAVEGRRYALPIARLCLTIISKEDNETFLEALLNTCRQWYQEREKVLFPLPGMKTQVRGRFTAFIAFLTEMFCQLKRRQFQLLTNCEGTPPPLVILRLLSKCCQECVKLPVHSLTEVECLFFVLTCIGRDLENFLPNQLEELLASVRDAFLNSNTSSPAVRKTLLQLIELQASRWQLPGNTVLYYYPSTK